IPEELWNLCNQMLEQKTRKQPLGPKPVHLFAGLLFCGCGQRMYVFSRSPKYICPKCRNKIPMNDIEEVFREELRAFFITEERIQKHLRSANSHLEEKKSQLSAHTQKLEKVRAEMRKTYQLYLADQITPLGFGKIYKPMEQQEQALASELPKLQGEVDAL